MKKEKELTTLEEIKAFSDPYRLQILTTFRDFNRPATVKEIADHLKETPAKVYYHVKKLEKVDILKLVDTKEINGIIAKYYFPTADKFSLKQTKQSDELNQLMLNETQRVINTIYDTSKKLILAQLKHVDQLYTDQDADMINSANLYLSKEEIREFNDMLERFSSKTLSTEDKKQLTRYHFFNVYFPIPKEEV